MRLVMDDVRALLCAEINYVAKVENACWFSDLCAEGVVIANERGRSSLLPYLTSNPPGGGGRHTANSGPTSDGAIKCLPTD